MINPDNITTIRVDQLPEDTLALVNEFAHTNGTELKKATIQSLVDLVSAAVGAGSGVGFLPISVTDGQQLPDVPTDPSFFLAGIGTYLNINGYPDLICTQELNAIMSLSDHWGIAVEIPINAEIGVQSVTGSAVDNTDPLNPIVNLGGGSSTTPTLQEVTNAGNVSLVPIVYEDSVGLQVETGTGEGGFAWYFKLLNVGNGFKSLFINDDNTVDRYVRFPDKDGFLAMLDDIPTKTSDLINDGDDGNPFISLLDLPSNIIFYPTNVASDVSGYVKIVTSITDPDYNTTAVDVSTGAITTTNQLISSLATSPNIIVGNPGVFNITTIGNIRRISGSGTASFYFQVYKRTSGGVETLIATSDNTIPILDSGTYVEFSSTAIWNDGIFSATDRVVMKYYANRIAGGSNPTYEFQFGGVTPVRTLVPIPLSVVPVLNIGSLHKEQFEFTSSQTFTLANNYGQVYSVEVKGQGSLHTSQYTLVSPNQVTINDTLESGDYIVILYSNAVAGLQPYYSQAEVDVLLSKVLVSEKVSNSTYFQNTSLVPTTIDGMSLVIPLAGTYKVDFNAQFNTTLSNVTAQAVIDLNALYLNINGQTVTNPTFPTFGTGTTILPGVYETVSAVNPTGTITLDGQGNANSIFIFRTIAALTSATACTFNLINGATSNNVFFIVGGAITIGANGNLSGTFITPLSAVGVGAGAFINGRVFSQAAAITNNGSISVPALTSQFAMGILPNFAIFTSVGALVNIGANVIVGDIGTNNGTVTGFETATLSGNIYLPAQGSSVCQFSIYVNGAIVPTSTRERTNAISKDDVILSDVVTITAGQTISIKNTNSIGISRFYNRNLTITKI